MITTYCQLLLLLIVGFIMVGCASTSTLSTNVSQNVPVTVDWLNNFNDPTLSKAVRQAQVYNPSLQSVVNAVEQANRFSQQDKTVLMKTVAYDSINTSLSYYLSGRSIKSVEWEELLWNRIKSGSSPDEPSDTATNDIFAQHSLAAQVVKSYARVTDAQRQLDILKQQISLQEQLLEHFAGDSEADVDDIVEQRNQAEAFEKRLQTVNKSLALNLQAVETLTGKSFDDNGNKSLPDIPPPLPGDVSSRVLERRPDIIAARQRITASFTDTDDKDLAALPLLALTSEVGASSSSLLSLLNPTTWAWKAVTGLFGLFFSDKDDVKVSSPEQEQALLDYGQVVYGAFKEVELYLDEGVQLQGQKTELDSQYKQASDDFQASELRYERDEIDETTLLIHQQSKLTKQSELNTVQRALIEQRVNLYLAMGGSI